MATAMDDSSCETAEKESISKSTEKHPDIKPTCVIVLGMAGSGKTTFVQVNCVSIDIWRIYCVIRVLSPNQIMIFSFLASSSSSSSG